MAKEYSRTQRIGDQMQRELAELIRREVKDPRVGLVTITAVDVSRHHGRHGEPEGGKSPADPGLGGDLGGRTGLQHHRGRIGQVGHEIDVGDRTGHLPDAGRLAPGGRGQGSPDQGRIR